MKEAESVGEEIGLGVESDEVVAERTVDVGGGDGSGVENARVGVGWWRGKLY